MLGIEKKYNENKSIVFKMPGLIGKFTHKRMTM